MGTCSWQGSGSFTNIELQRDDGLPDIIVRKEVIADISQFIT